MRNTVLAIAPKGHGYPITSFERREIDMGFLPQDTNLRGLGYQVYLDAEHTCNP